MHRPPLRSIAYLGLLGPLVAPGDAAATIYNVTPADDIESIIQATLPGDEVILADGLYTLSERFSFDIAGTAAMPIVIRAAAGANPHLMRPTANQNIIDIDGASYVVIRGIEFSGGSAGIRISESDHLTIEGCEIHDSGDVAIRANDVGAVYDSLRIADNHIHDTNNTGEGMYLGCNNGGCTMMSSIIERNYVHHTDGPTVTQGDGIELKEGSYDNVIRDNVIHDTNYPCILTYATQGNGGPNVIERNLLWNCGDHGIQAAADAEIRNNIILSAAQSGIAMQMHQSGAPDNLVVAHNTILKSVNDAITLRDTVGSVTIANNAVFAQSANAIRLVGGNTAGVVIVGNVGAGGLSGWGGGGYVDGAIGTDFVAAHYGGAPPIDVYPAAVGSLVSAGDGAWVPGDDFNTTPRGGVADVGAYAFAAGGNPGWVLEPDFKQFPAGDGDGDGDGDGSTGDGDGATGDGDGTTGDGDGTTGDGDGTTGDGTTGDGDGTTGDGDGTTGDGDGTTGDGDGTTGDGDGTTGDGDGTTGDGDGTTGDGDGTTGTTGDGDGTTGDSTGASGEDGGSEDGGGTETSAGAGDGAQADGCACSTSDDTPPTGALGMLALLSMRRRRRAASRT